METITIPKDVAGNIVSAARKGIPPSDGLEHVVVGRRKEVEADKEAFLLVENGGSIVKLVIGDFGSGKSFELQRSRYIARKRGLVTMHTDFTVHRKLYAHDGSSLALWKHLIENVNPSLETILGSFMDRAGDQAPEGASPAEAVDSLLREVKGVGSVYFRQIISKYCEGVRGGDRGRCDAALRWLRGSYRRRDDARRDLGKEVEDILTDDNWYDILKCMTRFVTLAGYKALAVYLDEAINLYKIDASPLRNKNYEMLLTVINDKVPNLLMMLAGTHEFLEDRKRGLYSYGAMATRLTANPYATEDCQDNYQVVISLAPLRPEDIAMLAIVTKSAYDAFYGRVFGVTAEDVENLMNDFLSRPGARKFLSPREVTMRLANILDLMVESPERPFDGIRRCVPVKTAMKQPLETTIKEI